MTLIEALNNRKLEIGLKKKKTDQHKQDSRDIKQLFRNASNPARLAFNQVYRQG